jgi:hypothetical protein
MQAGIPVEKGLMDCCGVDSADKVSANAQSKVIDYFTEKAETAAA